MVFISCINLSSDGGTTPLVGELREVDDAEFAEEVDSFDGGRSFLHFYFVFQPVPLIMPSLYVVYIYCASLTKYWRDIQTIGRGCRNFSTSLNNSRRGTNFWDAKFHQKSARTFEEQYTSLIFLPSHLHVRAPYERGQIMRLRFPCCNTTWSPEFTLHLPSSHHALQ